MTKLKNIAPSVLRIGIALVFLWFGIDQLIHSIAWVAYVPDYAMSISGLSVETIIYLNGLFEIIFGSLLLFGLFTRLAALLLFIHILDIAFIVGWNATGVRDFGLTIATLAIFLHGSDWFSLDGFIKRPVVYGSV